MTENQEIIRRLDSLIRLVAVGVCAEKTQRDSIEILDRAGLGPKEIAEFLGTTPNTVSVSLSAIKRQKATKRPSGQKRLSAPKSDDTGSE
jgi:DNA-binding NarL/FixJ family response regulator